MRGSSRKDYSVFDFNAEDKAVESSSRGLAKKFGRLRNPRSSRNPPVTKFTFLKTFIQGSDAEEKVGSSGGYHKCRNDSGMSAVGASKRDSTVHQEVSEVNDTVQDKLVNWISDDDESLKGSSLSTSISDPTKDEVSGALGCSTINYCIDGYKHMVKKVNAEVVVYPDFVFCGARIFPRSQLTFSSDLIKLEVFSACESSESFSFEWAVDEVVYIECRQSKNVDVAYVELRLTPAAVKGVENLNGSSSISKLSLAVSDPKWQEKEQMITSLAASYKSVWNPIPCSAEMADEDDDFMGQSIMFFLRRYYSNFNGPFEDVIYPKGDSDAVCISKRDIELLQPETFINDTIIDFYIKYLKNNKIQQKDKHRFHFFNSFFFRKLADLDKDPRSALAGRAAFLRVRKWTRKVNIFEKDYIFIPINFNLHWSLIVVCHPGEIPYFTDEETKAASKVPCILHMDSIKGSHRGLKNLFQSYLWEEWKERHESSDVVSLRFSNLRFIPLELPQQENSFDCGLFLLHYVELFLKEAPVNFNPFKITKFSDFLSPNWFPSAEASHKRSDIHRLINEIIENQSLNPFPASCSIQNHSKFPASDLIKEEAVEFLSEQHGSTKKSCLTNSLPFIFDREVEIQLPAPSSPSGVQYGKEMGTVSSEFFEHGNVAGSSPDEQYPLCDQIATSEMPYCPISTLEKDVKTNEQFVCSPSEKAGYELPVGIMAETCTTSYALKDVAEFEIGSPEIVTSLKEHGGGESSSNFSSCESTSSSEVGVSEIRDLGSSNKQVATETPRSASLENCRDGPGSPSLALSVGPEKCVVEISPKRNSEVEAVGESKESGESFFSCPKNAPASSRQHAESGGNCDTSSDDDVRVISDCSETRSKQLPHKRKKFMPLTERRCTRSMTRAWHL
ncbi:hypothetical protein MRB53_007334 [Persea americana]|uniref:Uncharacterized protein n=1 Tax=Persea americana TaxID=3435 RepID=A0ACC2MIW4_PERAE|nr:hypothetical protein MRB53_007334 [Persea americana]